MDQIEAFAMHEIAPGHFVRENVGVTPWEALAYDEICAAAERDLPCPSNLDIEMEVGCNSSSVAPTLVARLQTKGLIRVKRIANKYRRVQIVATGKWTAKDDRQKCDDDVPHVPRGARKVAGTPIVEKAGRYKIGGR